MDGGKKRTDMLQNRSSDSDDTALAMKSTDCYKGGRMTAILCKRSEQMFTKAEHFLLKDRYEAIGAEGNDRGTASDYHLRELEIDTACLYMQDGQDVLDVGCGTGYSLRQYASRYAIRGTGIDYATSMIKTAEARTAEQAPLRGTVTFQQASVVELPFSDNSFDVITSARCLMALLDWNMQQSALTELQRVLRPGGVLVLMEGVEQGLVRLNEVRKRFGLAPIASDGRDRLLTLKFDEPQLISYGVGLFDLVTIHRFGMYYFLSRVLHPLLVAPEAPRYDARINDVAREIARIFPNFQDLGHLVAFIWKKRCLANSGENSPSQEGQP
jgi:ubiquinone/menaquinone biosynthesis C-methylase UbiE